MSAQRQLRMTLGKDMLAPASGIVLQHENKGNANALTFTDKRLTVNSLQCFLHIATPRHALHLSPVLHTGNNNAVRVATLLCHHAFLRSEDDTMLVEQQLPPRLAFQRCCLLDTLFFHSLIAVEIGGIVVIAKDTVHAVFRLQLAECSQLWFQLVGMNVFQVANKDNGIGTLCIDTVNGPLQQTVEKTGHRPYMSIGKHHDAIAVECFGQVGGNILHMANLKVRILHEGAVAY